MTFGEWLGTPWPWIFLAGGVFVMVAEAVLERIDRNKNKRP